MIVTGEIQKLTGMVDPLEAPQSAEPVRAAPHPSPANNGKRIVRSILFVHLAVVLVTAAFMSLPPAFVNQLPVIMNLLAESSIISYLIALIYVLSMFGFPLIVLVALGATNMPARNKTMAVIAKTLMVFGQFWVLLPVVQ